METLHKAKMLGVDLSQVPSALYSPDLHEDLTQHLGMDQAIQGGDNRFWATYLKNLVYSFNKT